ncbi:HD domain-containing protein [uncultured Mucilaginibacter sp.]|uniref:HD domain-containing protein n=1 Tax=uncultured Mucilaginibacter sp. TaxID=797541 RepID=UPI002629BB8C|nr:HD domain-containing protein [uncultured Mucilaginibacter sp.]
MNKKKIINDPVYGFINIPTDLIFDLVEHRYFQRLRYIKQLGMTHLVYPGALHTRFHHALGALHLMGLAVETLRTKDVEISAEEEQAVEIAILLHDIGHGPFSHALENTLVKGVSHEMISRLLMDRLNKEFDGQLEMAIRIFNDTYPRHFLHQLVSGQLDIDRMDYLNRDSFFTGVSEGVISFDRILKMLNVRDDHIVVEEKGIYSVEKFLIARRLMYWQVYLHKTVIAAEMLLVKILERSREMALSGAVLFATPALAHFLNKSVVKEAFVLEPKHLDAFISLDDTDILSAIKVWVNHSDFILSDLCTRFINRNLYKVELSNMPPALDQTVELKQKAIKKFGLVDEEDAGYYVFTDRVVNDAYKVGDENIRILLKNGEVQDIADASDNSNLISLSKRVIKYVLCVIKGL